MGLSFFNARRAKQKVKNASIDATETLSYAKDEALLPPQGEESLSLDPQPIENLEVQSSEDREEQVQEAETGEATKPVEPTETVEQKISDAEKIKNAKNKNKK